MELTSPIGDIFLLKFTLLLPPTHKISKNSSSDYPFIVITSQESTFIGDKEQNSFFQFD